MAKEICICHPLLGFGQMDWDMGGCRDCIRNTVDVAEACLMIKEEKDMSDETTTLDYTREMHETDKAKLFEIDGEEVWIPKSVIIDQDEGTETLEIKEWWAEKEGLV